MYKSYRKLVLIYLGGIFLAPLCTLVLSSFEMSKIGLFVAGLIASISGGMTVHGSYELVSVHRFFVLRLRAAAYITTVFGLGCMIYTLIQSL